MLTIMKICTGTHLKELVPPFRTLDNAKNIYFKKNFLTYQHLKFILMWFVIILELSTKYFWVLNILFTNSKYIQIHLNL